MSRFLLVSNTDWYLYNFRLSLARTLRDRGVEVTLVSPPGPYAPRLAEHGFAWHPIRVDRSGLNPAKEVGTWRDIRSLYRKLRPDLVHHFTVKPIVYGSLAAKSLRVPGVVNSVTGLGYVFVNPSPTARWLRPIVRALYRQAFSGEGTRVIFQNPADQEQFHRLDLVRPGQSVVIPGSGVDPEQFRPVAEPPGTPLVILPARMLWDKGVAEFAHAARRLREQRVAARFALVGGIDPGNPASLTEAQLRAWEREGILSWWGHRDDMPAVYAQSHVVVLPSYGEGVPRSLIEAAASARPAVASDIPGCRMVVEDGSTGFLVPPRDGEALAEAVKRLVLDPALRRRLGEAGRRLALERFTDVETNRKTLEVYAALVSGLG